MSETTSASFDGLYQPIDIASLSPEKTRAKIDGLLKELPKVEYNWFNPDIEVKPPEHDGLYTGISTLDEEMLGFRNKEVMLLGALPNTGKSTLSMYLALQFISQGKKVVYIACEDSKEDVELRLTMIAKANGLEEEAKQLGFLAEEDAMRLVVDHANFVPIIDTLADNDIADIFVLDMLNNIIDPLEDRDFSETLSTIRMHANALDYSIIMTCRFRQPQGATQPQRDKETYDPNLASYFGKMSYTYSATKCVAIAPYEEDPECVALIINKTKVRDRSVQPMRHIVRINNVLNISQSAIGALPKYGELSL